MQKQDYLKHVGSMQQMAYVRPLVYREGRAEGLQAWQMKNGPMQCTVMADKCLDIAELSYKGYQLNFISKPGLAGRNHYDTNGDEALRSIMGGMLFTCGMENICAPCMVEGKDYPMHGRIRTTPAEHMGADAYWDGDSYVMEVSGEMREAELFGENLVLRRKIKTVFPEKSLIIENEIENQSWREEPLMLLYHFNAGYPLLSEESEIVLPSIKVIPRDETAAPHTDNWSRMEMPRDGEPEYVFLHELAADEEGNTFAALINKSLGLGLKISYNKKYLPYFMQWKSLASGDYVIGLEPANSSVYGRLWHEERQDLHTIAPFEKETMTFTLTVLEGEEELEAVKKEAEELKRRAKL